MSKLKKEFDSITPPERLKSKVKNAVASAAKPAKPVQKTIFGISRQNFVALATAAVMFVTMLIASAVVGLGKQPLDFALKSFDSVDALKTYITDFNRQSHNRQSQNSNRNYDYDGGDSLTSGSNAPTAAESGSANKNNEHSTTNNQVRGVAESDIVHTDGNYIYTLSYYNLAIIDAQDLSVKVNLKYDNFFPDSMFLLEDENMLVVIGSEYDYTAEYFKSGVEGEVVAMDFCRYWYGNTTVVKTYDIAELLQGSFDTVREMKFKNSYFNSARMIENNLYLVLSAYNCFVGSDIWIPQVYDSVVGQTRELPIQNIYVGANNGRILGYTLLVGMDVTKDEAADVNAYLGSSGTIYSSAKAFYMTFYTYSAVNQYGYTYYETTGTAILRFEIDGINLNYAGGNTVEGTVLNQFSMDEHTYDSGKTYFRIATTLAENWNYTDSQITVFDSSMNKVGKIEGLGEKGERIYSVRFNGTQAVVVTYMQTDPLYVLDLSQPTLPKIVSALKIPGVSDYLHFLTIKDDYVFAVGRRGEWLQGVKVSLFDISGTEAAREIAYFEVGADYNYAEATYNHKAIMYFKPSSGLYEAFAFAVNSYTYNSKNGVYSYTPNHNLYYYIADENGLKQEVLNFTSPEIKVAHKDNSYFVYYQDSIRRSVIIGNYVYLIGSYGIQRYNTNDFDCTGNYAYDYAEIKVDLV